MGAAMVFAIAACINVIYWLSCREFYLRNQAEILAGLPYVVCTALAPPLLHVLVAEFLDTKARGSRGSQSQFWQDFVLLSGWTCVSCLGNNLFFDQVKSNASFLFVFQILFGVPLLYSSSYALPHVLNTVSNVLWTLRMVFVLAKYFVFKSPKFWCMLELWHNVKKTFYQVFT